MNKEAKRIVDILRKAEYELFNFMREEITANEDEVIEIIRASQDLDSGISYILDKAKMI